MSNPNLQFLILCDSAQEENGKVNFGGVFDNVKAKTFPAKMFDFFLVTRWIGEAGSYNQKIAITLNDKTIFETDNVQFNLINPNLHLTLIGRIRDLVLPDSGTYFVNLYLGTTQIISIPLNAIREAVSTSITSQATIISTGTGGNLPIVNRTGI